MAARRRDQTPPYEIMRHGIRDSQAVGSVGPESEPPDEPAPEAESTGWGSAWRSVAATPILLRVPRGFAILLAAVVLGLIVLSYWVGLSRGNVSGRRASDDLSALVYSRQAPNRLVNPDGGGDASPAEATVQPDPRKPGLNYLIVARYPLDEANSLAHFLGTHRIEVAIICTSRRSSTKLYHVVVLKGFSKKDMKSGIHRPFEKKLRQLGQEWKTKHRGSNNLNDMYFDKYKGP